LAKQQAKADKELAKKRAANLTAAEESGQPSVQPAEETESVESTEPEVTAPEIPARPAVEPSLENTFGKSPEAETPAEEEAPKAEDVFGT
jgi:hypothetical protein